MTSIPSIKLNKVISLSSLKEGIGEDIKLIKKMLSKRGNDLLEQIQHANHLREQQVGDEVSFVINYNVNFSNICIGSCKFCSYRCTNNNDNLPYRMNLSEIENEVRIAVDNKATEICIQGGLDPDLDYTFYLDLLKTVRKVSPSIHIHAFSPSEIAYMSQISGEYVEDIFRELKNNGLNSFPGTAAEILVDEVRKIICPEKITTEQWINIVSIGHALGLPSTATIMYGHVETLTHQAEHLAILRKIQEETNTFTELVTLPFIHQNTALFQIHGARAGSTGLHDIALLSASRIYLGDILPNLQSSWPKLGKKFVQFSLNAGVNDLGGTLFKENISKSAGAKHGNCLSPNEFVRLIKDANRIPVQRDTIYTKIQRY